MRIRIYLLSAAIASFGLLGFSASANAAPCKNAIDCVDRVVCLVGHTAGLQCVD